MKKIYFVILSVILAAVAISSCSKMNDIHDEYLKDGPIIYVGKIDSLFVSPGRERAQIDYYITDPRAKELCFYWNNGKDSAKVQVPAHDPLEMQTVILDPVAEGEYTFWVYSYDGMGHRSIRFEQGFNTYGDVYVSTLNNRRIVSATCVNNVLTITFGSSSSTREQGIEISYTDINGASKIAYFESALLSAPAVIENVDPTKEIGSRTVYTPVDNCIDVFYTAFSKVNISE